MDAEYRRGMYDSNDLLDDDVVWAPFDQMTDSRGHSTDDPDPELEILLSQSVEILYEKEEEKMGYWWSTPLQDERDMDYESDRRLSLDFLGFKTETLSVYEERPPNQTERESRPFDREKVFPCDFPGCGKRYAKSSHLKAHVRRHTGEKPFPCDWPGCSWKFSRSDELARHRRSHSGVKPYKCCHCEKRFARSDHLAKHTNVHRRNRGRLIVAP